MFNIGLVTNKFSKDDTINVFRTCIPAGSKYSQHVLDCWEQDFSDNIRMENGGLQPVFNVDFFETFSNNNQKYIVIITFAVTAGGHLKNNPFITLPQRLLEDVRCGKAKIVLEHSHECYHMQPEFRAMTHDRLTQHLKDSKLPINGIVIATEDFEWVNKNTPFSAVFKNIFIEYLQQQMFRSFFDFDAIPINQRVNTFLCLNFIAKKHRKEIVELFCSLRKFGNSKVSFSGVEYDMEKVVQLQIKGEYDGNPIYKKTDLKDYPLLQKISPIVLDLKIDGDKVKNWASTHSTPEQLHSECLFSVVTESFPDTIFDNRQQLFIFTTEKTYKAIANKHPFLITAAPYTLKHLKDLGFKTFSEMFNEQYDEILDDTLRLEAVKKEILRICSLSRQQQIDIYRHLSATTEFNRQHFLNTNWAYGLTKCFEVTK